MVSERLERMGCFPCEGDLVVDETEDTALEKEAALELETTVAVEIGAVGKKGGRCPDSAAGVDQSVSSLSSASASSSSSSSDYTPVKVKRLTASDIATCTYSIYDVVMPLPGGSSEYPSHSVGREMYEQMMGSEGVSPEALKVRHQQRYVLDGGYRKILRRVDDAETAVVWYESEDQQLQPTDRDMLHYGGLTTPVGTENNGGADSGRKLQGVIAKFTLSSSSYATMCLRQLLGGRMSTKAGAPPTSKPDCVTSKV